MQPQCAHHMTTHAILARSMNHIARATKQTAACTCAVTTMVIWSMQADVLACQCMACGNHRILTLLVQVTQQQPHSKMPQCSHECCRSSFVCVYPLPANMLCILDTQTHTETDKQTNTHRHTQRQTDKQTHTQTRHTHNRQHTHRKLTE